MSLETTYVQQSVKITAGCFWIWFADIHLWIQQTKHLQCIHIQLEFVQNVILF
jgi:hypothetical protein